EGRIHTGLVEEELSRLVAPTGPAPDAAYAVAAAAIVASVRSPLDPWSASGAWRIGQENATTVLLREGARERAVRLVGRGPYEQDGRRIASAGEPHRFSVDGEPAAAAAAGT